MKIMTRCKYRYEISKFIEKLMKLERIGSLKVKKQTLRSFFPSINQQFLFERAFFSVHRQKQEYFCETRIINENKYIIVTLSGLQQKLMGVFSSSFARDDNLFLDCL